MSIVAVFQGPGLTRETYEESVRLLTNGKERLSSPADWPVEGLLVHVAGEAAGSFRVVDVWESEAAFQRFADKLGPVMKQIGIDAEPEIYPAHTVVSG
jgi:hypothetical protein